MMFADWTGDLTGLTPLILGCFFAAGVVYFRHEIKDVIGRVTQIEAKRKDTTLTATMRQADGDEATEPGIPADKSENPDSSDSEPIPSVATGADDADSLRAAMIRAYLRGEKAEGDEAFEKLAGVETDPIQIRRDQILRSSSGFIGGVDPDGLKI